MPDNARDSYAKALFALAIALALTASPLRDYWASSRSPWWTPFAVWAVLIGLGAWLAFTTGEKDA